MFEQQARPIEGQGIHARLQNKRYSTRGIWA